MKFLVLLALFAGTALAGDGSVQVATTPARQGSLPAVVEVYGVVAPGPDGSLVLSLPFDSEIASVEVAVGEHVHQGDILAHANSTRAASVQIEQAQSGLVQAQAALDHTRLLLAQHLATLDQLQAAQKALADAKTAVKALKAGSELTAPGDGVVSQVAGGVGFVVSAGGAVVTLQLDAGLEAVVGIEPADRAQVKEGAAVSVVALDDGSVAGGLKLRRLGRGIDAKSRLVDGFVPLPAGRFVADQPLKAEIVTGVWRGWLVPRDAVVVGDDGDRLFQVKDGKAHAVTVTVVGGDGVSSIVAGAVEAGLPIVISGQSQLDDGTAVRTGSP